MEEKERPRKKEREREKETNKHLKCTKAETNKQLREDGRKKERN